MAKDEGKGKGREDTRDRHDGAGNQEALLRLVNVLFDTDEEHLPELTEIPRNAVFPLSIQMMKEGALDPERKKNHIPLTRVWRISWMKLMRSVGRKHFMIGSTLASEQAQAEAEKAEEELEW